MWRGLQGGYPDPPQKIFEQPETPVKKVPHVARLTSGQSRSLLSFSFMISRRDFGRGGDLYPPHSLRPRKALMASLMVIRLFSSRRSSTARRSLTPKPSAQERDRPRCLGAGRAFIPGT